MRDAQHAAFESATSFVTQLIFLKLRVDKIIDQLALVAEIPVNYEIMEY